ncbi:MAG TPA: hypothetical protein VHO03_03615 [Ignavibacteriales bacterium]|nr:hypothetical protein [Ignavibacteriales bacterium]
MTQLDLNKIQGDANATLVIRCNFTSLPEGKVKANVTVERNNYNLPTNPKTETSNESYNFEGTPEEVQAGMETDLNLGSYLTISTGV